jgi:hypothetical protein
MVAWVALGGLLWGCGGGEPASPTSVGAPAPEVVAPEAPVARPWGVEVKSLRYDPEASNVFVEARLSGGDPGRTEPIYVGVTVVTEDGRDVDLMVQTLFPGGFDAPVLFSAGIEGVPRQVLIGAWNTKVEPCQVDRPGCKEFGFVLDASLASWPPDLYSGGGRQRLVREPVSVLIEGAPADTQPLVVGIGGRLAPALDPFAGVVTVREQVGAPTVAQITHRHADDAVLMRALRAALAEASRLDLLIVHDPAASADFVVSLPPR